VAAVVFDLLAEGVESGPEGAIGEDAAADASPHGDDGTRHTGAVEQGQRLEGAADGLQRELDRNPGRGGRGYR
jgi:hypothetical protein